MREVAALILAAGQGTRFDSGPLETKLVAKLRDKPLVRHVAEAALASSARPVLVITGHASERVAGALDGLELQWVHNPDYAAGLAGSLKAGIRALPQSIRGALVLLGDMPFISAALIEGLIGVFQRAPLEPLAVLPTHAGRRGNPALLGQTIVLSPSRPARDAIHPMKDC